MSIPVNGSQCGKVKNQSYEIPYSVTGTIQLTGSKQEPTVIYVQIGLLERGKQSNTTSSVVVVTNHISTFNDCESGGTTCEALVMRDEEQPPFIVIQVIIGR